jgi:hypothetical protein
VCEYAAAQYLPAERYLPLLSAANAVAMNAVKNGGGEAMLATDGRGMVQVRIKDGCEMAARTADERSAAGYDWWLIARPADRVWIYPGDLETVVILEQGRTDRRVPLLPGGPGAASGRRPALPFLFPRSQGRPSARGSGGERDRSDETQEPYAEDLLVLYRQRSEWSQDGLARRLDGVCSRTVRNWEAGVNQPQPVNLTRLIEVYLAGGIFLPGREIEEARRLWRRVKSRFDGQTKRLDTYPRFDEARFALLLGVLGSQIARK